MVDLKRRDRPNPILRAALGALASLGLAATVLAVTAGPTLAFNTNRPDALLAGYGVNVGAHVVCDYANHRMFVSAEAMVMTPQGEAGPMAGPYDAGQYLRYNVFVREVGQADWWPIYSWSVWQLVRSSVVEGTFTINHMVGLGSSEVTVIPGHNYEALVQVDYWTGVSNVINVTPTYGEVQDASISSYILSPGVCRM